jgi:ferric iron reductase protein FhuF
VQAIVDTLAALGARQGEARVRGVAPGLVVTDPAGWLPATRYAGGDALPGLIDAAVRRFTAPRHVAAALAWKQYSYWLLLPAVLGYAQGGPIPDLSAGNVLVQAQDSPALVRIGLASARPATSPIAEILLDRHLTPMLDGIRRLAHVGRRTLLGSVASAVCYALVRSRDELPIYPGDVIETARQLTKDLGVADLVELTPAGEVRRRTCCLAFALPVPKICAGCCIRS